MSRQMPLYYQGNSTTLYVSLQSYRSYSIMVWCHMILFSRLSSVNGVKRYQSFCSHIINDLSFV